MRALDLDFQPRRRSGPLGWPLLVVGGVLVPGASAPKLVSADLVSRMTTKGLLAREQSSIDARAKTVSLSGPGQAALDDGTVWRQSEMVAV